MSTQTPQDEVMAAADIASEEYTELGDVSFFESSYRSLAQLFYPIYKRVFTDDDRTVRRLEQKLAEANINIPIEIYMSAAMGVGAFVGLILGTIMGAMVYSYVGIEAMPQFVSVGPDASIWVELAIEFGQFLKYTIPGLTVGLVGAAIGIGSAIGVAMAYPRGVARKRKRQIDLLMPDVIAFMYSLSVGGMNQLEIFEAVAAADDTYGEVSTEFQRVTREMTYFGTDYQTAVQSVAEKTPSEELSKFMTDMLSIINSGGDMTHFLETQKEQQMREVERTQEELLDTLELFSEMYISLKILPMLLMIILIIMSLLGNPQLGFLVATVYGLLPFFSLIFVVMISVVKQDRPGNGLLEPEESGAAAIDTGGLFELGVVESHYDNTTTFERIRSGELTHRVGGLLRHPLVFFRRNPHYTLAVTAPISGLAVAALWYAGIAEVSFQAMQASPMTQTIAWFYVPVYINVIPVAFFYEWSARERAAITDKMTDELRKLANTNETGQTLLESMRITAEDSDSKLGGEFMEMYKKVKFGTSLKPALVEFNNRYRLPRLARTVRLVSKAQEASSQITDVLKTAAAASENQDSLQRQRKSRTKVHVVVIAVSFLVFLGVMVILQVFFVDRMISIVGTDPAWPNFENINPQILSMLYFHAVTIEALFAGFVSGYIQNARLYSGLKYVVAYMTIAATVWWVATVIL